MAEVRRRFKVCLQISSLSLAQRLAQMTSILTSGRSLTDTNGVCLLAFGRSRTAQQQRRTGFSGPRRRCRPCIQTDNIPMDIPAGDEVDRYIDSEDDIVDGLYCFLKYARFKGDWAQNNRTSRGEDYPRTSHGAYRAWKLSHRSHVAATRRPRRRRASMLCD